jgi:hypothetical protein
MRHRVTLILTAALLVGCSSLPQKRDAPTAHAPSPSVEMIQAAQLASFASALQALTRGNPSAQAEAIASARNAYDEARAAPAALRYGLMLAAPDHPLRDLNTAKRVLEEAMAQSELLTPTERALGNVELARIAIEQRLVTEVGNLIFELEGERELARTAPAIAALNKRLQSELEETARLRKLLDEARAKLDAITRMERNFSDRPPAPEGRNQ